MQWDSLGFKSNPFSTDPISQTTLDIYTGNKSAIKTCQNILKEKNVALIVEGARGVGTTSFANYLRFSAKHEKKYFTPRNEVRVEPNWSLETLLGVILSNVVRELDLDHPEESTKDKQFQNTKALSMRIAEAYRSFGIEAFGFGVNYEKTAGISSQPIIVPSSVLGHHLEDLSVFTQKLGYRNGILIQLNNLDIGAIHEEKHLKYLLNALRDYIQTDGISWLLVGDLGIRRFIAQEVDRLDDIINYELIISSLSKAEYEDLLDKRINFYRTNLNAELPIEREVFLYLYEITKGRLRYIFGLLHRLLNSLHVGDLTDRITLDIAKPMTIKLARDRVTRNDLSPSEEKLLRILVDLEKSTVTELANQIEKPMQQVSRGLKRLIQVKMVTVVKMGKKRYYSPVLDAIIAYRK